MNINKEFSRSYDDLYFGVTFWDKGPMAQIRHIAAASAFNQQDQYTSRLYASHLSQNIDVFNLPL